MAAGLVAAPAARADGILCGDKLATIVGSDRGDSLDGTPGDDVIAGLGGGDVINGMGGNDTICGGDGNDVVSGGDGDDTIRGDGNNDVVNGGSGNDLVSGGAGDDSVSGGAGDDEVFGSDGRDTVNGDDGDDIVAGGPGNDSLNGGVDADSCREDATDSITGCEHRETGGGDRTGYTQLTSSLSDRVTAEVNPATGNLMLRATDLSIAGTGLNYSVVRTWNSAVPQSGAFGTNATMNNGVDVRLTFEPAGVVRYQAPSGFIAVFTPDGAGGYTRPDNYQSADLAKAGDQWTVTMHGTDQKSTFDPRGRLVRDSDRNGNANAFTYNSDGTLARVDDTQGRAITFDYESGRVHSLTDPTGRHVLYSYDGAGNLTQVTEATGAVWKFSYFEGNPNINQIVDPRGNAQTFGYDENRRVVRTTYAAYTSIAASTDYRYGRGTTQVRDPRGNTTTYEYDHDGRITSSTDAVGNHRESTYDPTGNITAATSPSSAITNFTYRPGGQLSSIQMPAERNDDGSEQPGATTTLDYADSRHAYLPTQETDPEGSRSRFTYNASGNLTSTTTYNADGSPTSAHNAATTKYQGDDNGAVSCGARPGQVCSEATPAGNTTTYGYDAKGNVTSISPPAPLGRTLLVVDPLSRVTSQTDGRRLTTTYTYDANDRLTSSTTKNATIRYEYDPTGNLTSRANGAGTTSYTYDAAGHPLTKSAPGARTRYYSYDLTGNMTSSGDRRGSSGVTRYVYDAANQPTSVTDAGGAVTVLGWTDGRRTSVAYPGGITQRTTYDNAGRPQRVTAGDGTRTYVDQTSSYRSASGAAQALLAVVRDAVASTTTSYTYDGLGRLATAATSGATSSIQRYIWDDDSNRTQSVTNGVYSAIDTFNAADQLVQRGSAPFGGFDRNGNATSDGSGQTYVYGPTNQTTRITPPGGSSVAMRYLDVDQNERTVVGPTRSVWGQLGIDQDTTAGATTTYLRDPSGGLISERTPSGTYYYLYDVHGSVVGLTDASGARVNTYAYDPFGNPTSDPSAAPVTNPWRWNAGYLDNATGLYHFGARYYDPELGRFTQVDPSRQEANPYLFAQADPVNRQDPSGLSAAGCIGALFVFAAGVGGLLGAIAALPESGGLSSSLIVPSLEFIGGSFGLIDQC